MRYVTLGIIALTLAFVRAVEPVVQGPSPVQVSEADEIPVEFLEAQARNDSDRWFLLQRTYPSRTVSARGFERALREVEALKREARTLSVGSEVWAPVGPRPISVSYSAHTFSGRVTALAPHPTDPDIMYLGADTGGVWKTTDGGGSWWMLTSDLEYPNIKSIAVDPKDPNIVYVGTRGRIGPGSLLRSTDGGKSWLRLDGPVEFGLWSGEQRVIIDPSRAGSAQTSRLYAEMAQRALFRSDDSGRSFQKVLALRSDDRGMELLQDFAMDPIRPETVLALVVEITCAAGSRYIGCQTWRQEIVLYRSFDSGNRWSRHGIYNSLSNLYSARIAVSPVGASSLIAAFLDSTDKRIWVFRSADFAESWSVIPRPTGSYLAWPLVAAFAPNSAETVYIGNLYLHKSTNWGETWTDLRVPHVDQTVVTFDASGRLISGNDGGIFRAGDSAGSWTSLNDDIQITQFYGISLHPSDPLAFAGGTQDNGTVQYAQDGRRWSTLTGGDGGHVVFDASDPGAKRVYTHTQWMSWDGFFDLYRCENGRCSQKTNGINKQDSAPFIPHLIGDASNPSTLYLTAERVYRTQDRAENWSAISQSVKESRRCRPFDVWSGESCAQARYFNRFAVAPTDPRVVYGGTLNGDVLVTTNGGSEWRSVGGTLPVQFVSDVVVDPSDARTVYVTFSNWPGSGFRGRVFRTSDGGNTWVDLTGNLPEIPVTAIILDPDTRPRVMYIGTDLGVFRSADDGGKYWRAFSSNLPPVSVQRLAYNPTTGVFLAATYGRGVYAMSSRFPPLTSWERR